MVEGEHYYLKAYHTDNGVWEHMTIAVEIEATDAPVEEEILEGEDTAEESSETTSENTEETVTEIPE